ncbi:TIGR01212 family radical SAM protein [Lachnospiraceae bacterium MD1]|uniref:TIGR01212 family radical SAM protein n=1 Tax=Variimorphobacter saccharofermentans TaxID=2755051 RepID=A0A839JVB9_9FIRM|nr:TIGR01212 family radical SAM protein [Variimorphobacter saccharofermentans]MBB2181615.1 TIGR01212 family radical SAM protein [Variimorphobacter saccharofermentans]
MMMWDQKRYHSLDYELKKQFGQKVYRLSLNGGMTCPNRDGRIDTRGCIFCSEGGSGDFAANGLLSITDQIEAAKKLVSSKIKNPEQAKYIAYFQAYTNTYAPISYLRRIFSEAIDHSDIVVLSIATRPDCIDEEVLSLLCELKEKKPVWIELGLQTMHESTANLIRRGYPLSVFENCVKRLHDNGIPIIVHTILGLPKETKNDMLKTIKYISELPVQGVKLQLLHILSSTDLGTYYLQGKYQDVLTLEEYIDILIACLELLPGDMVIHRLTGDGPKKLLLAPSWSSNKKNVLNTLHKRMKELDTYQGKYYPTLRNTSNS